MPRQKEFEREEALEKALEVFWRKGYNATSFQSLTEGMCINRQSIYDTYGDKHTLFIEALNHYSITNTNNLKRHFSQNLPVKELFKTHFDNTVNRISSDAQSKGCMMSNAALEMIPHDMEVKKLMQKNIQSILETFREALERGIKTKEIITKMSPDDIAMHLVNSIHGMNTLGKAFRDKKKLSDIAHMALSVL